MPLYEYQCDSCGHRFELIQKFSDPPAEKCPKCGGPVHKMVSAPAFQLKGTGWYVTDYAKKDRGGGSAAAKDEKPATGSDAKSTPSDKTDKPSAEKTDKAEKTTPAATSPSSAGDTKS